MALTSLPLSSDNKNILFMLINPFKKLLLLNSYYYYHYLIIEGQFRAYILSHYIILTIRKPTNLAKLAFNNL